MKRWGFLFRRNKKDAVPIYINTKEVLTVREEVNFYTLWHQSYKIPY